MPLPHILEQLQKTIIILSLPAEDQIHALGGNCVCDEMAIDFFSWYSDYRDQLEAGGWLNPNQIVALEDIARAFPKNIIRQ